MRYETNFQGMEELARGSVAQGLVKQHGERLAAAAGDGFVASYMQGRSRFGGDCLCRYVVCEASG